MISQRQIDFRQEYRSRIIGWYDGYFHIAIIYAMGAAAFYVYVQHIHNVSWIEWLTVPLTFLFTNVFEWAVHKYIMHRPVNIKGLRAIYERHTLNHHQFFTDDEMRFRDHKDWRVTVFPPYALVVFILMSLPAAAVIGTIFSPNVGWLFMSVTTGMYLIYEFMHFCCHVDENWFVRSCPFVNTLRRHHTAHHNARLMMETNMNLTFPIADWLFGTSDLDRGLIGTLLNGYDTDHLKKNLRGHPRRPDEAAMAPMGSY
ncbi:MAG: sterol desaturase family protein [Pseudolabrys sp.]